MFTQAYRSNPRLLFGHYESIQTAYLMAEYILRENNLFSESDTDADRFVGVVDQWFRAYVDCTPVRWQFVDN